MITNDDKIVLVKLVKDEIKKWEGKPGGYWEYIDQLKNIEKELRNPEKIIIEEMEWHKKQHEHESIALSDEEFEFRANRIE